MERYKTLGATTLAEDLDASETAVDVASAAALRDTFAAEGDIYRIKVDNEIMAVTSEASNTLTVARGSEGTTAATHANGAPVTQIITASAMDRIKQDALSGGAIVILSAAGAMTLGARNHILITSGTTATMTIPAAAFKGQTISVSIDLGTVPAITLDPGGGVAIDGDATKILFRGEACTLVWSGTTTWLKVAGKTIAARCKIRLATAQTLADTTSTTINFDATDIDNTGLMANLTAHGINIRRSGHYHVQGSVISAGMLTGNTRWMAWITNGATTPTTDEVSGGSENALTNAVAQSLLTLAAGDLLLLQGFQISIPAIGQPLNIGPATDTCCYFNVVEIPQW